MLKPTSKKSKKVARDERTGIVVADYSYAYRTSIPVAIGDRVIVTVASTFHDIFGETQERTITGFETDYDGRYGYQWVLKKLD